MSQKPTKENKVNLNSVKAGTVSKRTLTLTKYNSHDVVTVPI
jgi:hypothetical protein